MRFEKGRRGPGHAAPAEVVDGRRPADAGFAAAGLHFDEHDRLAVDGDDVDLAVAQPAARGDDLVALAAEVAGGADARPVSPESRRGRRSVSHGFNREH